MDSPTKLLRTTIINKARNLKGKLLRLQKSISLQKKEGKKTVNRKCNTIYNKRKQKKKRRN